LETQELEALIGGLRIALKYAKYGLRVGQLQGFYFESLVAKKLLENGHAVAFHEPPFDLLVDGNERIEVKSGKFGKEYASAEFKGEQIKENKFDFCVFVIIHADSYEPMKFLVFSRGELEELFARPRSYTNFPPCTLFYYNDIKYLEQYEKRGETVLQLERELVLHPEKFEDRWNKIH